MTHALLLVDIQNDFIPGGALAVREGDLVVPIANALRAKFDLVVATQDWHPANHGSFASNHPGTKPGDLGELGGLPQIYWPDHCVQGTPGSWFHAELDLHGVTLFRSSASGRVTIFRGQAFKALSAMVHAGSTVVVVFLTARRS